MHSSIRKFFYPPYTSRNLPILLGIVLILIVIPLTVFFVLSTKEDTRSRAEGPEKKVALDHAVSALPSSDIQIVAPKPQSTVSLPLTIQITISPSVTPASVEFWKDADKTPFAILYQPTDTTNGNLYEVPISSLRPGRHILHVNAVMPDNNILTSDEVVFFIQ